MNEQEYFDKRYWRVNHESDLHIMPQTDIIEHISDINCDCFPSLSAESIRKTRAEMVNRNIWIHKMIADPENKN